MDSAVTPENPVVIYIAEELSVGVGGELNPNGRPASLQIYTTDERADGTSLVEFGPDSTHRLVLAGEELHVRLGGDVEVFGSVDLNNLEDLGGVVSLHYDRSLENTTLSGEAQWVFSHQTR